MTRLILVHEPYALSAILGKYRVVTGNLASDLEEQLKKRGTGKENIILDGHYDTQNTTNLPVGWLEARITSTITYDVGIDKRLQEYESLRRFLDGRALNEICTNVCNDVGKAQTHMIWSARERHLNINQFELSLLSFYILEMLIDREYRQKEIEVKKLKFIKFDLLPIIDRAGFIAKAISTHDTMVNRLIQEFAHPPMLQSAFRPEDELKAILGFHNRLRQQISNPVLTGLSSSDAVELLQDVISKIDNSTKYLPRSPLLLG